MKNSKKFSVFFFGCFFFSTLLRLSFSLPTSTYNNDKLNNNYGFVEAANSDKSYFNIVLPDELKSEAGLPHSEALFGIPPYGGSKKIVGEVVFATRIEEETGCSDYETPDSSSKNLRIFLVDRGDCSFVQKVRKAQSKGAAAVIVADDICQCTNANHKEDSSTGHTKKLLDSCNELGEKAVVSGRISNGICESKLPYMADDGSGGDVTIPSFLVDHFDGQRIKDCYLSARNETYESVTGTKCREGTRIILSLFWDMPAPDDNVEYDLWTSSDSEAVFKKEFFSTALKLKDYTTFTPHYFIWDGESWGCIPDHCLSQCTDGGLYCNPDPDHDIMHGASGKDIVEENLRQICVWKQAEPFLRENAGEMWWNYVALFADKCHPDPIADPKYFNEKCSKAVHDKIQGLSWSATQKCVQDSWLPNGRNTLLDTEIQAKEDLSILQLPTVVVNNVIERGGVKPVSVLSTICAGFLPGTAPKLCGCVGKASGKDLELCAKALCSSEEKYCSFDYRCYSVADYPKRCTSSCAKDQFYCSTLGACVLESSDQVCPDCPDDDKPFFCPYTNTCISDRKACKQKGGVSAVGVFFIVAGIVSIVASAFFIYFKRQKKAMHQDVRNILSEYMPLDEFEARNGTGNAPAVRTNGDPTLGGNGAVGLI